MSMIMIIGTKDDMTLKFPAFYLSGQTMCVSKSTKLGHIIRHL